MVRVVRFILLPVSVFALFGLLASCGRTPEPKRIANPPAPTPRVAPAQEQPPAPVIATPVDPYTPEERAKEAEQERFVRPWREDPERMVREPHEPDTLLVCFRFHVDEATRERVFKKMRAVRWERTSTDYLW